MDQSFTSSSVQETQDIARHLVAKLKQGITICLYGDLAAGKTTFTQGLAGELGISRVISPTFIIMRQYPVSTHPTIKMFYHLDLYRLSSVEDIKAFDIDEIWSDPTNLLVVEWPEKFADFLPQKHLDIYLKATGDNQREIQIKEHH